MNETRILPGVLLSTLDPSHLYPGIVLYDKASGRKAVISDIVSEYGKLVVYIYFEFGSEGVDAAQHSSLVVLED